MEYRRLGASGLKVSEIGLGSWLTFGSSVEGTVTAACVRRAFDLGVIFFDTADIYARGAGEEALGAALRDLHRPDYVLATKCFWPMSENPNDRGLSRKHIIESCEASLRRLGVDYLDVLQCHRYDPVTPVLEVVRAMDTLIRQGKILYWGVSCWTAEQIVDACHIADRVGAHRPISNQPPYNLLDRDIEAEVIPISEREGVGQVVFSPLAQGILTGKYSGGNRPSGSRGADSHRSQFMERHLEPEVLSRVDRMVEVATSAGLAPGRLALAWCLRRLNVASVIVGATTPEQVETNVEAAGVSLSDDILEQLDALFPQP